MLKSLLKIAGCTLVGTLGFTYSAIAAPSVPITSIRFVDSLKAGQARGILIVPDKDTTRSVGNSSLRRYDAHMAKMFEVANEYCSTGDWNSVEWHYFAANGSANMGKFVMGCNLVRDIFTAYGSGQPQKTVITYGYGNNAAKEETNVATLNLTGSKISKFVKFAKEFRPVGQAQRIDR